MQRLGNKLSNKFQKRTHRVEHGQTQAYPYAGTLDSSYRSADGNFNLPSAAAKKANSLLPGLVAVKKKNSDEFKVSTGAVAETPFGLLANWVGGDFDELGDENSVGVWKGVGSTHVILAPAFDDSGANAGSQSLTTAVTNAGAYGEVALYAGADGRLCSLTTPGTAVKVARLLERVQPGTQAAYIRIELLV